jgi:acyl transferase domain-containing protein
MEGYIRSRPSSLNGAAYTLSVRRDHLLHRTFCIADGGNEEVEFENFQKAHAVAPCILFVFTGQGAQWAGMGMDLMHKSSSFRQDIRDMDRILQSLNERPPWTIEG